MQTRFQQRGRAVTVKKWIDGRRRALKAQFYKIMPKNVSQKLKSDRKMIPHGPEMIPNLPDRKITLSYAIVNLSLIQSLL